MCGIGGIRAFRSGGIGEDALRRMAHAALHRGPDEQSVWLEGGVGLAHTRLSIIDLARSHQPMHSVDGNWVVVFNGEIFNYRELRRGLDYPYQTEGDTETIVAGLVCHGIGFVERLRGQFALAILDRSTGTLHLVRDRLGILPLYYRQESDRLLFGSEPKVIFAAGGLEPQVNLDSLDAYLTSRAVAAPHTLYEGIKKVMPGHRLEVSADGRLSSHRYWHLPGVDVTRRWTRESVVAAVDTAVRSAVDAALVADVPVGSYLSGGVDSSLIVAMIKALRGDATIETFAAGFGDPRFDELEWARLVSQKIGTSHHEVHVRAEDFQDLWPRMTRHRDAPISEPADMAVFRLAEEARRHVTVVLSGEGGDELFAGYPKYQYAQWLAPARFVPPGLRRRLVQVVDPRLPRQLSRHRIALRAFGAATEAQQIQTWFAPFTESERRALLGGSRPDLLERSVPQGADAIDRMLRFDLESWLPDNLLERGDRMSMASSLELRPPLLDHELVELAFQIPSRFKVHSGTTKWVLKEVARRYLPAEVVDRRKVGFRVPLDDWFRTGLRDAMWDMLTGADSFVGDNLDRHLVRSMLTRHEGGRFNEESRIWTLMSLEVWHQTCVRHHPGDSGS